MKPVQRNIRRCLLISVLCLTLVCPAPLAAKRKDKGEGKTEIRPHVCAIKTYQVIQSGRSVEALKGMAFILAQWRVLKEKHYLDVDYSSFLLLDEAGTTYRAMETDALTIFKSGTGQFDVAFEVPNSIPLKGLKIMYKNAPSLVLSFDEDDIESSAELPCASFIMDFERERMAERERMMDEFHKCMEACVAGRRRGGCLEECKALYPGN
ncbi:hypothetical protein ACFL4G_01710 [Thermodesulfobacteriota bacterium]